MAVASQCQTGVAQCAGDPDVVIDLRSAAPQGAARCQFAEHGDADGERAFGGVAADKFDIEGVGQIEQAARKAVQPAALGRWQGQCQREADRARTHRGQIGQIHGQTLVAQPVSIFAGEEMAAFHQHVRRNGGLHASAGGEQGAIVTDAEAGTYGVTGALEVFFDEVEFGEHRLLYAARRYPAHRCH